MKRVTLIAFVLLVSCSFKSGAAQEVTLDNARSLLHRGSYKEAIAAFKALLAKNAQDEDSTSGLISAETATGDYTASEQQARDFLKAHASSAPIRALLAEVELVTGRYAEAASEAEHAARDGNPPVSLRATMLRVQALDAQGKEDEARDVAGGLIRFYNETTPRSAEEITLVAQAAVYLEKFKDANELFIDAREADPSFIEAFIKQGELLNQKYNYGDAASLFLDALKINQNSVPAMLGLAVSKQDSGAEALVDKALKLNPNSVDGLVLKARFDLEKDKPELASESAAKALATNPNSVDAMAVQAGVQFLAGNRQAMDSLSKRALANNPRAGDFFSALAQFAVINRRYDDAVEFGRRAVELSPRLWSARTELGIQLLRVGRVSDGRAELERAFAGDPYNIWAKNTLDLLDSMRDFADTLRGQFIIRAAQKESGALALYAADLAQEAYQKLTAKYRFTPKGPITVEVFANHDDFAVRSLGLPGLGALGVCFGRVIAMDSPAARNAGEFNWGSTLWHEFTHVITLQTTDNRIPRWFSEGLSVFEERRARPGWGDNWSMQNLKAYKEGRFVKIDDLDSAFTRPKTPDGVPLAYFEASQVCEFVNDRFGFDAILKMLAQYKEGAKTRDVLQRALGLAPDAFDKAFDEYLKGKAGGWLNSLFGGSLQVAGGERPTKEALVAILKARPDDYVANLRLGVIYKTEGDTDRAIEHLRKAIEVFPYYAAEGNPYQALADLYESKGQKQEEAAALEALLQHNETNAEALARLARLRLSAGDKQGVVDALRRSFYIQPFDASLHKLAGDVYLELGNANAAADEFRVALALTPPDMAEAHYDLARALDAAGKRTEARREVLKALEIAPGFEKAQELLLKLRGSA